MAYILQAPVFASFEEVKESFFFSIWVFLRNHLRITRLQGKGESISLTPHYHFHPLHRHFDISRVITAESSPLHIGSSRTRAPSTFRFRAQVDKNSAIFRQWESENEFEAKVALLKGIYHFKTLDYLLITEKLSWGHSSYHLCKMASL